MEVRIVMKELAAVLVKHGVNVELDSVMLEIEGDENVFRCRDLKRVDWNRRRIQEFLDNTRTL